ncbi:hypothetical protein [Albimonas pacifica]|uniref:CDP-Glycerol:Poly(Glycerophosphate) glycerophosphotransferase n=1 Tax=Albimonas pacifica TaxID=1114924 RepID=A0A1I3BPJ1_9RHOB|nr:hypothetical protein [Albimonas pacifica]SFH64205.1 hypothetical protein SAMN05216258_101245 [Albimonas pacifica]
MHVGVLLNHYEPHQVPHVAPYAFALSRLRPEWTVRVLCSTEAEAAFAADIGRLHPGQRARIERLPVPLHARLLDPALRHVAFYRKTAVLKASREMFAGLDALLTPELTSLSLKDDPRLSRLRLIHTGHGTPDPFGRPLGLMDPRSDRADLRLVQSRRIARIAQARGRLREGAWGIAGYPKFELARGPRPRLFDDDRPVVIYNPTQSAAKTSWRRFGPQVLDHFARSDRWNLIFAPHVLLFRRRFTRGASLPRRFRSGPGLRIDLGSRASVDMTYLRAADLYLGDQSSQIYEFIQQPRPCVFLNAHGADPQGADFRAWSFGPVISDPAQLDAALDRAMAEFPRWEPVQRQARDEERPEGDMPASERGAAIVAEFLETGAVSDRWR